MAVRKKTKVAPQKKFDGASIPITQEIELVEVNDLTLWKDNPRENDEAAKQIAELFKEYGFVTPITIDQDNVVRKGNTGVKAARLLNMPRVPAVRVNYDAGKLITYGIADNKSSEYSSWDDEVLAQLMSKPEVLESADNRETLGRLTGMTQGELRGIFMEPDLDRINNLSGQVSEIQGIIKIRCQPENLEEIRDVLNHWAGSTDFENVEVI